MEEKALEDPPHTPAPRNYGKLMVAGERVAIFFSGVATRQLLMFQ